MVVDATQGACAGGGQYAALNLEGGCEIYSPSDVEAPGRAILAPPPAGSCRARATTPPLAAGALRFLGASKHSPASIEALHSRRTPR